MIPEPFPILGIPIHPVTMAETLRHVPVFMAEPHLHQIATVNPEFVMQARENEPFRQALQAADLCIPDGIGLVWASYWLKQPLPERVPGSELIYHIAALAAQKQWRLFLLGAAPGVAEEAAAILQDRFPGLRIVGTYAGSPDPAENEAIVNMVNSSGADILYVAYGAPKQDLWIARNRSDLTTVKLALGVGGSLDFITGRSRRAPQWLQRLGLEWFYRLLREPWRWRRMLALPRFAWQILRTGRKVP